jgi:hypothetical protein
MFINDIYWCVQGYYEAVLFIISSINFSAYVSFDFVLCCYFPSLYSVKCKLAHEHNPADRSAASLVLIIAFYSV